MAKESPVKKFGKIAKKIQATIKEVNSQTTLKRIGQLAIDEIYTQTKLGYGFDTVGGPKVKLAPLTKSYKDFRAGRVAFFTDQYGQLRKYKPKIKPTLDSSTTPNKSNLTFSGSMLRSLTYKVGRNSIKVFIGNAKDAQKAAWAHEGSPNRKERKFLGLTLAGFTKVRNLVDRIFSEKIKTNLGKG